MKNYINVWQLFISEAVIKDTDVLLDNRPSKRYRVETRSEWDQESIPVITIPSKMPAFMKNQKGDGEIVQLRFEERSVREFFDVFKESTIALYYSVHVKERDDVWTVTLHGFFQEQIRDSLESGMLAEFKGNVI